jgi:hypothetical protein
MATSRLPRPAYPPEVRACAIELARPHAAPAAQPHRSPRHEGVEQQYQHDHS